MKRLPLFMWFLAFSLGYNIASAQLPERGETAFQGKMEVTVDVSKLSDTAGRFMMMIGGKRVYPTVKNKEFTVYSNMKEPRNVLLVFYPAQQLNAYPGKPLYLIPAAVSNCFYFLGLPGKYNLVVPRTVAQSSIVNPSPYQRKYQELRDIKAGFFKKLSKEHSVLANELANAGDQKIKDSLVAIYRHFAREEYPEYYKDSVVGFIRRNPDEPASLIELEEYSNNAGEDLKGLQFLYDNLSDNLKVLPAAERIYGKIDQDAFATDSLAGRKAIDFTRNDPTGNPVLLSDFSGQVILLEFWASWCGPCRASNPGLVKLYAHYRDKGFTILGVSLDSDKGAWEKAIKKDGLTWPQVLDSDSSNSEVSGLYHVHEIPFNVLIGKSGKIIAVNLEARELGKYLSKVYE
jgi:peroxiredoxin